MYKIILFAFLLINIIQPVFSKTGCKSTDNIKCVPLKEFTRIDVNIFPDLGTRLVFPFILENPSFRPQYYAELTNPDAFSMYKPEASGSLVESNVRILKINVPNDGFPAGITYLGKLFITVDGYNITLTLKTTSHIQSNTDEIIFLLDDEKRNHLIENEIERRVNAIREQSKLTASVNNEADFKALSLIGLLSLEEPKIKNVKEEHDVKTDLGQRIRIYAGHFEYFSKFATLILSLKNLSSADLKLKSLKLISVDDKTERIHTTGYHCNDSLEPNIEVSCVISTDDLSILQSNLIKVSVETDQGTAVFTW